MLQLLDQPFPAGSLRRLPRVLVPVAAAVTVCLRPEHVDDAPAAPRLTGQTSAATPISLSRRSLWRLPRVLELVDAVAAPTPAPAQSSLVGSASSRPRLQWRRGMCCFWNLGSTCRQPVARSHHDRYLRICCLAPRRGRNGLRRHVLLPQHRRCSVSAHPGRRRSDQSAGSRLHDRITIGTRGSADWCHDVAVIGPRTRTASGAPFDLQAAVCAVASPSAPDHKKIPCKVLQETTKSGFSPENIQEKYGSSDNTKRKRRYFSLCDFKLFGYH